MIYNEYDHKEDTDMVKIEKLRSYVNRTFENWGGVTSNEYNTFQKKYRNLLKSICENNNLELVAFHPNHYQFSAFIKSGNKFVYISISDVRYFKNEWFNHILIRTAKHEKDFTGGYNRYTTLPLLESTILKMLME